MRVRSGSVPYHEHRIAYRDHGEGERVLVLVHGLLMNGRMYDHLAPEMARRGFRVITVDMLGHGASDKPADTRNYNMTEFSEQLLAVIDALELDRPVVGGTSLGANVTLEMASRHPGKAGGLFIEMPVLESALVAAGVIFLPALVGLRVGAPVLGLVSRIANRLPRSHYLLDIFLDWARRDPACSQAVLEGIMFGRAAPPREERARIGEPALVIGHPADPLHPFSDSDMLVGELRDARLVDANSIVEWRLTPGRLDNELASWLTEVYEDAGAVAEPTGDAASLD